MDFVSFYFANTGQLIAGQIFPHPWSTRGYFHLSIEVDGELDTEAQLRKETEHFIFLRQRGRRKDP